jgi:transposase
MATAAPDPFSTWLGHAQVPAQRLTSAQRALLHAVFHFRQDRGTDYYSTRLLSHFLLHCGTGLKVAQLARLVGISRPTASRRQGVSSKQAIQQAHHRMDGRPYGKLLPRYAGPVAQFLCNRPDATRADLIDFLGRTFGIRVSRVALYHFLKKYGLELTPGTALGRTATVPASPQVPPTSPPAPPLSSRGRSTPAPSC